VVLDTFTSTRHQVPFVDFAGKLTMSNGKDRLYALHGCEHAESIGSGVRLFGVFPAIYDPCTIEMSEKSCPQKNPFYEQALK
jgi:hypothetical protein